MIFRTFASSKKFKGDSFVHKRWPSPDDTDGLSRFDSEAEQKVQSSAKVEVFHATAGAQRRVQSFVRPGEPFKSIVSYMCTTSKSHRA